MSKDVNAALAVLKNSVEHMNGDEINELKAISFKNLKSLMNDPNGVFAQDPTLAIQAYTALQKTAQGELETKRRCIDTIIKAKSLLDGPGQLPGNTPANSILPDSENVPDEGNSSF